MENKTEQTFTLEEMRQCWISAQIEMAKCFSSSYVGKTFEKYIEEKK